ncbi:MAG: hypothetical protein QOE55_223, partial [Acidobacteriaceae bacterium]|nr:hypothetical protein [Acidobacteriaceae bacterium]
MWSGLCRFLKSYGVSGEDAFAFLYRDGLVG